MIQAQPTPDPPEVLAELRDRVVAAFSVLPGEDAAPLGILGRRRAERLVRMRGPWTVWRLREGLRACLCTTRRQREAFDVAFREVFGDLADAELRRVPEAPLTVEPPVPVLPAPPPRRGRRETSPHPLRLLLLLGLVQCVLMGLGAVVVVGVIHLAWRPTALDPGPPPWPVGAPAPPAPPPATVDDPLAVWRHPAPPTPRVTLDLPPPPTASPLAAPLLIAGLLVLLAAGAWAWAVSRRRLRPVAPWPDEPEDAAPFRLRPRVVPVGPLIDRRTLDHLADAVGLVVDPDRSRGLDVPASVRQTARLGGFPAPRMRAATATRAVCLLADGASPALARSPVDRALADGLETRGLAVLRGRWGGRPDLIRVEGRPATPLDAVIQREPGAILLMVGEVSRVAGPLPEELLHHERAAWIDPTDPATWGEAHARWPLPLFPATAAGYAQLTRWILRGERPARPLVRRMDLPGLGHRALAGIQPALTAVERTNVEALLGPAVSWAAVLALWPGAVPVAYAERLRREIHDLAPTRWPELVPAFEALGPLSLDRVRMLPQVRTVADGLVFGGALRAFLVERLRDNATPLYRWALARHLRAAEEQSEGGALEREAVLVSLQWRQAALGDLDEAALIELLDRIRRVEGSRIGGMVRRERTAKAGDVRLVAAPSGQGLGDHARRLLAVVEGEPEPARWTRWDRIGVATLIPVGLALLGVGGFLSVPEVTTTNRLEIAGAANVGGAEALAWVEGDNGQKVLGVWWAGRPVVFPEVVKPTQLLAGTTVRVEAGSGTEGVSCADGVDLASTTVLRCPPEGYEAVTPPSVEGSVRPLAVGVLSRTWLAGEDADTVERFLRLLFHTGSIDLVVLTDAETTGDTPLDTNQAALVASGFGEDRDWLGGGRGRLYEPLDAWLAANRAAPAAPFYRGTGVTPEAVEVDLTGGKEVWWTLPVGSPSASCSDARGRSVSCTFRAEPLDAPGLIREGAYTIYPDAEGAFGGIQTSGDHTYAYGRWHFTVNPVGDTAGLGRVEQDHVIGPNGATPPLSWNLGAPRYSVSLRLSEGETATIDEVPYLAGRPVELEEGDHSLNVTVGCQRAFRTLNVGPAGWWVRGETNAAGRLGSVVFVELAWAHPALQVDMTGDATIGEREREDVEFAMVRPDTNGVYAVEILVDGRRGPWMARELPTGVLLPADLARGRHTVDLQLTPMELNGAVIEGTTTIDWNCGAGETTLTVPLKKVASAVAVITDPLDAPAVGGPTGRTWTAKVTGKTSASYDFVELSAGEFTMGSRSGVGDDDEHPRHRVALTHPFLIGRTEVTQAVWEAVMGDNPSTRKGATLPVESVSWCAAADFANRLSATQSLSPAYPRLSVGLCEGGGPVTVDGNATGFRLPTEAEWEYAARAGTATAWPWGDDEATLAAHAWYSENGERQSHPVGQKAPSSWGLADMAGNVWEWVGDWKGDYQAGDATDPIGPPSGDDRVFRGGSAWFVAGGTRSACRFWHSPVSRFDLLGFRLVLPSPPPSEDGR